MKQHWKKIVLFALILLLAILSIMYLWKHFIEWDNGLIDSYINTAANKYNDSQAAAELLSGICMSILEEKSLTDLIKQKAKDANLDKERVLVDMAVSIMKTSGYAQ